MQKPAGKDISPANNLVGQRKMVSKNKNVETGLTIDNIPYKGNAVLNANK